MCGERDETISHVVAECKKLAQPQYKVWRHDRLAVVVHWNMCKRYKLPYKAQWYEHTPERVLENDDVKLLWDFPIQTDHHIDHNKPDIVIYEKKKRDCWIIDVACPFDTRVEEKEQEKLTKYQDLRREINKLWNCRNVNTIPIVVGALGTVGKRLSKWLKRINMEDSFELLQKSCLLGTARIIRKVLENG